MTRAVLCGIAAVFVSTVVATTTGRLAWLHARRQPRLRGYSAQRITARQAAFDAVLHDTGRDFVEANRELQGQWALLLNQVSSRVHFIGDGLGMAEEKATVSMGEAVMRSPTGPVLLILIAILVVTLSAVVFFLIVNAQLPRGAPRRRPQPPKLSAQRAVLRALGAGTPRFEQKDVTNAFLAALCQLVPPSSLNRNIGEAVRKGPEQRAASLGSYASSTGGSAEPGVEQPREIRGLEALEVRIRQRVLDLAFKEAASSTFQKADPLQNNFVQESLEKAASLFAPSSDLLKLPEDTPSAEPAVPSTMSLRDRATKAHGLLFKAFPLPEDQQGLVTAVNIAIKSFPMYRWRFKESVLQCLIRLGADSRAIIALLLHDIDECLSLPWPAIAEAMVNCPGLGEEVVSIIDEKKTLEQLGLLLYLRALSEDPNACQSQDQFSLAAAQLARLVYLRRSKDFRSALIEIAEIDRILCNMTLAVARQFQLPDAGRALARCALDLHAPIAHSLGYDDLIRGSDKVDERLSPSLEQRALRLYFPEDYSMIEAWMCNEDQLLHRTLSRCIREVRKALDADAGMRGLASCEVKGRVKSVYSLVKKLLRQRGVSRLDLKTEAVKDLLAMEVVVHPNPKAEVPSNPEWLAEEWRERAACFCALDILQRYARSTKGWWILPNSTKDYITKSKKSGYRALHITLGTNVTTLLPKGSSPAMSKARPDSTMPCKLEVHVFSASMKAKERKGMASHHLYKAFEMSTEDVFASFGGNGTNQISPSDLRTALFPVEHMQLRGRAFAPSHINEEFGELCANSDHNQDGVLSYGDVQLTQQYVSKKLEDFRLALEHRHSKWWVHGVNAPKMLPTARLGPWSWAAKCSAELEPEQRMEMLCQAFAMTKDAHAGQFRKSGEPYWTHPLAVADILARTLLPPAVPGLRMIRHDQGPESLEEDARALWPCVAEGPDDIFSMYTAALLHDTVEDTSVTVGEIETAFGAVIASLVDGVTKASSAKSRASRSAQDLRKVLARAAQDVRVLIIKFADRLHNLRTLEHMPPTKQRRIAEETRAVYAPLAERVGMHLWKTEFEELCSKYINGYAHQAVIEQNERSRMARKRNLRYIHQYIQTLLIEMTTDSSILDISMSEEPPHTQLRRWAEKSGSVGPPAPVPRIKVVTIDREACWACLGRIHSILPPMPGRLRDYISSPKENLYMCLHTTVLMDGAAVEVYIQSLEMFWVAEYGMGAFWRYHEQMQRTETGRVFLEALRSTWLLDENASIKQSLRSLEVALEPASAVPASWPFARKSTGEQQNDTMLFPSLEQVAVNQIDSDQQQAGPTITDPVSATMHDVLDTSATASIRTSPPEDSIGTLDNAPSHVQERQLEQTIGSKRLSDALIRGGGPAQATSGRLASNPDSDELYAIRPLLEHVSRVASNFADGSACLGEGSSGGADVAYDMAGEGGDGGELLAELHRAYSEALREKVAVFTPTGRVLYLPRDATPLDFAVWNLGARKGLRADAAVIDSCEAPLHTKLREGQTVLVHLRSDEGAPPPREWAGIHLRYLRTTRARAALVELRTELLSGFLAKEEGHKAMAEELQLHSLDLQLLDELGDEVLAAVGQGALPVELVSGELLASWLRLPLGDASHDYAANGSLVQSTSKDVHKQSFVIIAQDRPGLMVDVVAVVRERGLDFVRFSAEPLRDGLCIMVGAVVTDCALRFGSLMHNLRYRAEPLLLQRLPVEVNGKALESWISEAPSHLDLERVKAWKQSAIELVET